MSEWEPVRDSAGEVVGWMEPVAPVAPDEPDPDYFEVDRLPKVARRAAIIDQAADLIGAEYLDPEETWDRFAESGMSEADLDSAGYVAVTLAQVEYRYPLD